MYFLLGHQPEIVVHKQVKSPEEIFQLGFTVKEDYSVFWSSIFGNNLIMFWVRIPYPK